MYRYFSVYVVFNFLKYLLEIKEDFHYLFSFLDRTVLEHFCIRLNIIMGSISRLFLGCTISHCNVPLSLHNSYFLFQKTTTSQNNKVCKTLGEKIIKIGRGGNPVMTI